MGQECSIFFHNYYGAHEYWQNFFLKNLSIKSNLYYNKVEDSIYNIRETENNFSCTYKPAASGNIRKIISRESTNKGKDIGGKLVLLDAYQKLGYETEFGLFLHDKKSPQKANCSTWANDLLKIAEPTFSKKAAQVFSENPDIGIITAIGNVINEYNTTTESFMSTNKILLTHLQSQFNIFPASFQYVAGTMFWFRMQPINIFFKEHSPMKIRAMLENGNVTDDEIGSYTHCWERLLSWIVSAQGYKIKVI